MLTLERPRASVTGPDLMLDTIEVKDAFAGEEAAIVLTIRNLGVLPSAPVDVKVRIDAISSRPSRSRSTGAGYSRYRSPGVRRKGVTSSRARWRSRRREPIKQPKREGGHVGTVPDLAVSIEDPYRPEMRSSRAIQSTRFLSSGRHCTGTSVVRQKTARAIPEDAFAPPRHDGLISLLPPRCTGLASGCCAGCCTDLPPPGHGDQPGRSDALPLRSRCTWMGNRW